MSKPTLNAFNRRWPVEEIPQLNVEVTYSSSKESLEVVRADIERRLTGIEGTKVKIVEVLRMEIPEPERTEYRRLQDKKYKVAKAS